MAKAPVIRSSVSTSRGAHVRALWALLSDRIDALGDDANPRRIALREHRSALERAYPEFLAVSDVDLAWEGDEDATLP